MPCITPPAFVAASLAAIGVYAASLEAQDRTEQPGIRELEANLSDDRARFNARVESDIDDDLLELGRLVAMGGAEAGGADMACMTCHGAEGLGDGTGAFPRLAGQSGWYMYKQLVDYASEDRPNDVMSPIASRLTEREMEAVAAYYAAVDAPFRPVVGEVDHSLLQWGGQLGAVGSAERGIPACVNCHGPSGTGNPPTVPYIAGQYASYMTHQLDLWKRGIRENDALGVMSAIASKMTEEDMRAVSEYYARVRPPERSAVSVEVEVEDVTLSE